MFVCFFLSQNQWIHLMKEDAAVKKHLLSTFTHTKFSLGRRAGTPHYNLLEEPCEDDDE